MSLKSVVLPAVASGGEKKKRQGSKIYLSCTVRIETGKQRSPKTFVSNN